MKRSQFSKLLEFIILVAKILGIVPLSFNSTFGSQKKLSRILLILKQVLCLCGIIFICWMQFFYNCSKFRFNYLSATISSILRTGNDISMCLGTYLISIFYERNYRKMSVIFNNFNKIIERRVVENRKKISIIEKIIFGMSMTFLTVILYIQFGHYFRNYKKHNFCILFSILSLFTPTIVFSLNAMLLIDISKRFKLLNTYLKSIIVLAYDGLTIERYKDSRKVNLLKGTEECSKLYHMLIAVAKLVNKIFVIFIAIDFIIFYCLVIFIIYYLSADDETFNGIFRSKIEMHIMLFWTLVTFMKTITITYGFNLVATEANHFNIILHSIKSNSAIHKNLVITISHQLNFSNTQFTVFEMFPLKWSNFFTMLGSAMMFSIFFLQLNGAKNSILLLS
ncbi:uncharacterized protein LOC123008247 [Tribolium madens]|uniref:uncharacterized protein LOC123008247 n=1 Tax=Tribolium madens TaxID=41895 RepID=UPI001CF74A48|nr:uncharacterized protein LOC123008247 [Tribolium madens]